MVGEAVVLVVVPPLCRNWESCHRAIGGFGAGKAAPAPNPNLNTTTATATATLSITNLLPLVRQTASDILCNTQAAVHTCTFAFCNAPGKEYPSAHRTNRQPH
jgi:hypothetical protein